MSRPADDQGASESPDGEDTSDDSAGEAGSATRRDPVFDRYDSLTLVRVVGAITVLAVALRLVALGTRSAHWDEARVAYWAYFYADTGSLAYYWEEHGPVAQIVAARLFDVFGVTDFAARLPVALVGGLLPLGALLYRNHLDRAETVALALFLAFNAVLLYYSRFMRSDVLVAAFMFLALGCLVRFYDGRKLRYLLLAGVFLGLGFGSKENAIVYVLTWLGATALLADQFLHSPASERSGTERLRASFDTYREQLRAAAYYPHYAIGLAVAWLVTVVVVFAPRGQGLDRRLDPDSDADPVTLGDAFRSPAEIPALVDESLTSAYSGYMDWFGESEETTLETYISFLGDYVTVLVEYAPAVTAFAVVGIAVERYARGRSRALVMFMAYCGVASLVGYPLGSHIRGDSAWLSVHVIVPLAVPASVGLAWTYREARTLVRERSLHPAVVAVVVVVAVAAMAWLVPVQAVYVDDTAPESELVQYAQPHSDLGPLVETMRDAAEPDTTDVVVYYGEDGEQFDADASPVRQHSTANHAGQWQVAPPCSDWATTQPLNWYFAVAGVGVDCERQSGELAELADDGEVSVVVTVPGDTTVPTEALDDSYTERSYYLRSIGQEVVVYTDASLDREFY